MFPWPCGIYVSHHSMIHSSLRTYVVLLFTFLFKKILLPPIISFNSPLPTLCFGGWFQGNSHPKPLSGRVGGPHLTAGTDKLSWNVIFMPHFKGMGTAVRWEHTAHHPGEMHLFEERVSFSKHPFLGGSQHRGLYRVMSEWVRWLRKPREALLVQKLGYWETITVRGWRKLPQEFQVGCVIIK